MKLIDIVNLDEMYEYEDIYEDEECEECLVDEDGNIFDLDGNPLDEAAVTRQFKRYGNKMTRQYRCMGGPKKGRVVATAAGCGKRKDPRRVRIGKKSARLKKGERVRKTLRTKRKTPSKLLVRRNKALRGDV